MDVASEKRKKMPRSQRRLLLEDKNMQEMVQENCYNLRPLLQKIPGCEKVVGDDVQQWMEKDKQQELTDHDIITLLNLDDNEDDDNEAGTGLGLHKLERMSHSIGVKPLEGVLAYVEQQGETTDADISLRHWCSLTASKRRKARKQTSIAHFFRQ
jgi:hypothetical protein